MLIETNVLRAFCRATRDFANLPVIESAAQVGSIFDAALRKIGRSVTLPDGTKYEPRLLPVEGIPVEAFKRDQRTVRSFLKRIADGDDPKAMREELAPLLQRLPIVATFGFDDKLAKPRMYAREFGVEAACYLAIFAMLEPGTTAYVRRCELDGCENFVLHAGGRSRPSLFCCDEHKDQGRPQRDQKRPINRKRRKTK